MEATARSVAAASSSRPRATAPSARSSTAPSRSSSARVAERAEAPEPRRRLGGAAPSDRDQDDGHEPDHARGDERGPRVDQRDDDEDAHGHDHAHHPRGHRAGEVLADLARAARDERGRRTGADGRPAPHGIEVGAPRLEGRGRRGAALRGAQAGAGCAADDEQHHHEPGDEEHRDAHVAVVVGHGLDEDDGEQRGHDAERAQERLEQLEVPQVPVPVQEATPPLADLARREGRGWTLRRHGLRAYESRGRASSTLGRRLASPSSQSRSARVARQSSSL